MPLISVKNLGVKLNGRTIFSDVNFDIETGEIVSIIGPNGAGKTTLVKAILGLIEWQGQITFKGGPIEKNWARIGYVPQRFEFDRTFPITVGEFLELLPPAHEEEFRKKICEDIKVDRLLEKKLGELSGGELQRVLIAQAVLKNLELLILDEPTSGVDVEGVRNFYELIEHLNREHRVAIMLVSHEVSMVYKLSDKIIFLNHDLFCFGEPKEVITPEMLDRLYGHHLELRQHLSK